MDALRNVKTHIQFSISVLHAKEKLDKEEKFTPAINPAPNSNHEKQRRFFSTKKKKKRKNLRWAKPSNEEVNKAKKKMAKTNVKVSLAWPDSTPLFIISGSGEGVWCQP